MSHLVKQDVHVLIVDRLENKVQAVDTAIGRVPAKTSIDISGLSLTDEQMDTLLGVDHEVWREEAGLIPAFFDKFGDRLPKALWDQHKPSARGHMRLTEPPALHSDRDLQRRARSLEAGRLPRASRQGRAEPQRDRHG